MKQFLFAVACACALLSAQDTQEVALTQLPSNRAVQKFYGNDGTNITSACFARSADTSGIRARTKVSISAASNASPVVLTSASHGFQLTSRPKVTISGGTGNWTAINGVFTATIIDANTFSIPVDSSAFGALAGTVIFTTTAPRFGVPEWAVILYFFTANIQTGSMWLDGSTGLHAKCSDATSSTTNIQ